MGEGDAVVYECISERRVTDSDVQMAVGAGVHSVRRTFRQAQESTVR